MSSTNLSNIEGLLKRVYDDYVESQQNLRARSIDEICNSLQKYNAGGEGFFGAINDKGNESIGAINESEQFRTIQSEHYQQWVVKPKIMTAPIEFTGLSAKAADQDEEAFASSIVDALDRAKERLLSDENRQFFGLGTGILAQPAAAVASNATSFEVDSTQYLRPNQVVDIYSGATKTVDSIEIEDVDRQENVVYLASSVGVALATTDEIVKENIRDNAAADGKEMMGLRGIIDDGTDLTTFQGIDSSASRIWRGNVNDADGVNLTSDLLQRLIDDVSILSDEEPDLLIMHRKQRRKYLDLVVPQKRYMDGKMDTGFTKLTFNGKELFVDKDCQDDTVYAVQKKLLRKFEVAPIQMGTHGGSDRFLRLANFDKFQAYWRHYANFGTSRRNAHGKLTNLAKPDGVS